MSSRRSAKTRRMAIPPECQQTRARLLDFLDGALDGRTHQAIQRHLDSCTDCHREWEWQRRAEQTLTMARQKIPDPGDMRSAFYARLAAAAPRRRPSLIHALRRAAFPAFAVSALAAALIAGMQYSRFNATRTNRQIGTPEVALAPHFADAPVAGALTYRPTPYHSRTHHTTSYLDADHPAPDRIAWNITADLPLRSDAPDHHVTHGHGQRLAADNSRPNSIPMIATSLGANHNPSGFAPNGVIRNFGLVDQPKRDSYQRGLADAVRSADSFVDSSKNEALSKVAALPEAESARAGAARAELMSEEVSIHIVNEKNEEVNSIDVVPGAGSTDQPSVIHVEADANTDGAANESARP